MAHKNAVQIKRLIESLEDGLSHFFLHLDLKSGIKISDIGLNSYVKVSPVESINSNWGRFELVQATLNAMALIKQQPVKFDRIILLSGQDYPIKSNEYINDFYQYSDYSIFLDHFSIPDYKKWSSNGGLYRIDKYFFGFSRFLKFIARIVNFLALFIKCLQRTIKTELKHYHGSQWWTIDSYSLNYILNYISEHPEYITFHKYTFAPDELFFHTIILNADDTQIISKIFNDNKMLMKWENEFIAHPEILDRNDLETLKISDSLFARKFDIKVDVVVLDMIDQLRLTQK
ncbi:beta-1,6-N-acetylglucosaminyltransferase [Mucilaginibacter sp. UYCu711]|uniref:beta-1,6-N-acetylglucosaminyltransferase n=1 Tax=Mucilaginibacter sp. UYCu711 TaxID=3156339 RepID=UPI003D1CDF46